MDEETKRFLSVFAFLGGAMGTTVLTSLQIRNANRISTGPVDR